VDAPSSCAVKTGAGEAMDAWDMQQGDQYVYEGRISKLYRLRHFGPVSLILIDRHRRIRAVAMSQAAVQNAPSSQFADLVEQVLLNIGGNEAVEFNASGMDEQALMQAVDPGNAGGLYSWEFAAELQRKQQARGASGPQLTPVYPLLGLEAPDFELPLLNGTGTVSLSSLSKNKVTLLVLFWAGGDTPNSVQMSQTQTAVGLLQAADRMHIDWTLKMAQPGPQQYAGAQPFSATNTDIAKPSVRGSIASQETEAAQSPIASRFEKYEDRQRSLEQPAEGEKMADFSSERQWSAEAPVKRFSASLVLGVRHFSWDEFERQDLKPFNFLAGVKFGAQIFDFISAEASVLPSFWMGNFAENEDHYDEILQLFIPISINIVVKPSLGEGRFSPFILLGGGPAITSVKRRERNEPPPVYPTLNDPHTYEWHYADGIGFQVNPGIGAEFKIRENIFLGLDIRYFFMTIGQDVLDPVEVNEESTVFAYRRAVMKDFKYDNAALSIFGGYKF
jgi:hypothetical protein